MQILKQFIEIQLAEYDHFYGRIKLAKVVELINSDDKLTDFIKQFSARGEIIPPKVFNAALHEKLYFILGKSQRLKAGICYCCLLHLGYLNQFGFNLGVEKEMEILERLKNETDSMSN